MKKKSSLEDLAKNIDWNRALLTIIPLLQPFIIFGAWLTFSRMDTKAGIVSKIIALGESIPTIDLNVPKPVVLASLYDSTDDALMIIEKIIETLFDMPEELKEKINNLKEESKKAGIAYVFPVVPIFEGIAEIFGFALDTRKRDEE
jgi:hypothetical protein